MSWFKKIFVSQSFSQGSSQSSSQEPKVYYTCNKSIKEKNEIDNNEKESENVTVSELEECDNATQSTQDSIYYSWSGTSQGFDIRGEKRNFLSSDDEEEPWWESFKSQSTQKSTQGSSQMKLFSSQSSSQASSSQVGAISSQDDDKSNEEEKKTKMKKSLFI